MARRQGVCETKLCKCIRISVGDSDRGNIGYATGTCTYRRSLGAPLAVVTHVLVVVILREVQLADDHGRVAGHHYAAWDVLGDDCARADDHVIADDHAGIDDRTAADLMAMGCEEGEGISM